MKTRIVLLILIVSANFISCKINKEENEAASEIKKDVFKVTLNLVSKIEDDHCLLYTQDGSINFKDEVIYQHLKGSEDEQKLVFELPNEAFPTQLRIDFGLNNKLKEVVLKSALLEYKGNKKEINITNLGLLFRADDSKCTFDSKTGLIQTIIEDGKSKGLSLYPQDANLGPELMKLAK